LAIKPQALAAVGQPLHGRLAPHALLVSILAGTSLAQLSEAFGHTAVVRAMPNTPAQIGLGMSVWAETAAVSANQHGHAQTILSSFGQELFVAEEKYLDMATAINGSGPGYVFLMLEAMVDAGVQLGFGREVASQLVLQTVMGSVQYAIASDKHLAELRNRVTSPGGTTAAGLHALEEAGVRAAFANAIRAAYERSVALSGK
jgi:pyrroline-5-carboxylate reductase